MSSEKNFLPKLRRSGGGGGETWLNKKNPQP